MRRRDAWHARTERWRHRREAQGERRALHEQRLHEIGTEGWMHELLSSRPALREPEVVEEVARARQVATRCARLSWAQPANTSHSLSAEHELLVAEALHVDRHSFLQERRTEERWHESPCTSPGAARADARASAHARRRQAAALARETVREAWREEAEAISCRGRTVTMDAYLSTQGQRTASSVSNGGGSLRQHGLEPRLAAVHRLLASASLSWLDRARLTSDLAREGGRIVRI